MTTIIDTSYYQPTMIVDSRWNWLLGEDEEHLQLSIEDRIHQLETEAKEYRLWSITSMITSGVGVMTGVALFSIPVLGVLAGSIPLAGFLWSVIGDGNHTGKSTLAEIAASMGHWDDPDAEFNKLANFMEEHEAIEYKFLVKYQEPLIEHLMNFQDLRGRVIQYQQKLREFRFDCPLEFQERQRVDPERMKELLNKIFGDESPTVIQQEPTYTQQTRLPQAPPKVSRSHAVEVIGNLPPAKTQSQQAPTVLQDDLLYRPNSNPTVVTDNLPVYEEFSTEIQNHDRLPQFRDLAKEIANYVGHIGLVAKTQSGKTTLLIGSVLEAVAVGHQVILIDGKGDARLRALGQIQNVQYLHCNTSDKVANLYAVVDRLLNVLVERQDNENAPMHPITLICDEYNMIRDAVSDEGATPAEGSKILFAFDKKMKKFVLQGAAAKIFFRGSNHTSRIEDWGWNTGVLDSLSFLALGRNGAYESIEDLLRFQITNAKPFQILLEDYRKVEFDEPLALTTLKPLGFCRIPFVDYESQKPSKPKEQWLGTVRKAEDIQAPQDQEEDLSDLTEAEQAVVKFAKGKGDWIKARNVQQATMKDLAGYSTTQIRDLFTVLNEKGWGELQGSGDRLQFRYF